MINRDDYLIELPNLKIDQEDVNKLLVIMDKLSDHWVSYDPLADDKEIIDWGWWLNYPNIKELQFVKDILSKLPPELGVSGLAHEGGDSVAETPTFMKAVAGFHLKPHLDVRDGTLIIVLTPNPTPVYFADDNGNIILEHTYVYPTVINTHIWHGANNTSSHDRITFQIGIVKPWVDVVKILKDSTLT